MSACPMLLLLVQRRQVTLWESVTGSLNSFQFWFQVFVLLVCAPIWFPILRALYREIDRALRPEGGVFAREYSPREMKMLEDREDHEEPRDYPMKSIPRMDPMARARDRATASRPQTAASGGRQAGGNSGTTGRSVKSRRGRGF